MTRGHAWLAGILLVVATIAGPVREPSRAGAGEAPLATPFKVMSVTGEKLELDSLRAGGPVLIDFWATWCKPCVAALPEIEALHRRLGPRGLTVIGVSVDGPRNFTKVRPFAQRLGLGYPIVLDEDGRLQESFLVRAVPTTVLVSAEGRVVRVTQGWRPGETDDLAAAIEALLPDSTASARP